MQKKPINKDKEDIMKDNEIPEIIKQDLEKEFGEVIPDTFKEKKKIKELEEDDELYDLGIDPYIGGFNEIDNDEFDD